MGGPIAAGIIALYAWGMAGTRVRPAELIEGIPGIVDFVIRLFLPTWQMQETTNRRHGMGYRHP